MNNGDHSGITWQNIAQFVWILLVAVLGVFAGLAQHSLSKLERNIEKNFDRLEKTVNDNFAELRTMDRELNRLKTHVEWLYDQRYPSQGG